MSEVCANCPEREYRPNCDVAQPCPYSQMSEEEEEDLCDYTGDPCIGDKGFCEECEIMLHGKPAIDDMEASKE